MPRYRDLRWTRGPGRGAGGVGTTGKTLARVVSDTLSMLKSEVEARELSGPVRTLADMTPEERARLERELGAPINRRAGNTPGQASKSTS